jgi:penicillin G amidase
LVSLLVIARTPLSVVLGVLIPLLTIICAIIAYFTIRLLRSRPLLNGNLTVSEIDEQVEIERDGAGIPVISGANRPDVAFGLGFVHAQERFFQMDMTRRAAAGELSELLGQALISLDRKIRLHQFRRRARAICSGLASEERLILERYTAGVTSGLAQLRAFPVEYCALRATPAKWQLEDTLLVVFYWYRLLQDERADQDFNRYLLYAALPTPLAEFLAAEGSPEWDAPMLGPPTIATPIPEPEHFDFRKVKTTRIPGLRLRVTSIAGSNAWAVSGKHSRNGKAIIANDMHLPFEMPPAFFRATLDIGRRGPKAWLSGITAPGFPFLLAGTNGHIAWGLANAAIDATDLVRLDQTGLPDDSYRTVNGVRKFEIEREIIRVRGAADVELTVRKTAWGPITRKTRNGAAFAQLWLAYDDAAVNLGWHTLERAATVAEGLDAATRIACPALAMVVGDSHGDIGWTIAGLLPRRSGDQRGVPTSSSTLPDRHVHRVPSHNYPRLRTPELTRVWAANSKAITTEPIGQLLSGGYHACGARTAQIRDALQKLEMADEESMLRIQLDHRALFLARWHEIFLRALERTVNHPRLAEVRSALQKWNGQADADSTAYRLLRGFHEAVEKLAFEPFISIVRDKEGQFELTSVTDHLEEPLWRLVTERPDHLLPSWFDTWDTLLIAAAEETLNAIPVRSPLSRYTWGHVNALHMRHPLSERSVLFRWLFNPRPVALAGDMNMPLAQTGRHGPVFRFVISPGENETAIMQMAGGQSGNPLTPYYFSGHSDWILGKPQPLVPGPTRYTLVLTPQR